MKACSRNNVVTQNNVGQIQLQQWIFRGVSRKTNECFLVKTPNRSMSVTLQAIKENIEKGITIFSDSWTSNCAEKLEEKSF